MNKQGNQLTNQFMRLHALMVRNCMTARAHGDINPHKGQGRVLAILKMQPEMVQKELSYLLDMSKQALAEILNKLEKNGYITRVQSEKDRRSFIIKLTDKGREAIPEENEESGGADGEDFFNCLSEEEQSQLLNYLIRLTKEAEKKSGHGEDDYAEFFRRRFFERHGEHHHGRFFGGFRGYDPRGGFGGFGGNGNDDGE